MLPVATIVPSEIAPNVNVLNVSFLIVILLKILPLTVAVSKVVLLKFAVVNAGVVSGGADMRLYQAVELCGGFIDEADGTRVNLAMQLKDGDKIYIPYAYDDISLTDEMNNGCNPNATGISGSNTENSDGNSESYGSNTGGAGSSNLIDINKASKSELMQLSGIGEARALDIISYREKHGAFKRIEDIKNVSGIKDAAFNKIKDYICV